MRATVLYIALSLGPLALGAAAGADGDDGRTVLAGPEDPTHFEVDAADFVPTALLTGPGYRVERSAFGDGFSVYFRLTTEAGSEELESVEALHQRLDELRALAGLEEIGRSEVFLDAVERGITAPVRGAGELLSDPGGAVGGAVTGFGRWVGNVGRSAVSRDPDQEGVLSALTGYEAAKRGFALEFGVDPWSSYEPLQKRLASISRSAVAGGLSTSVAMGAVTRGSNWGAAVKALGLSSKMNAMVAQNPAQRLRALNSERLVEMGIADYEADSFRRNFNYTPMQQAQIVDALDAMGEIQGRAVFLSHASAAPDDALARYMVLRAQMLSRFVTTHGPADIVSVGGLPWVRTQDGALVTTLPLDYLTWTPDLAAGVVDATAGIQGMEFRSREVWVEGRVGDEARERLEKAGWVVRERVALTPRNAPAPAAPAAG